MWTAAPFPLLLLTLPASAVESEASLDFRDRIYEYRLIIRDISPCTNLIDVLWSLDTMRRLMVLADDLTVLEEGPTVQRVRLAWDLLGLSGSLVYARTLDREAGRMDIRLVEYENRIGLVPWPETFIAAYHVTEDPNGPTVLYTQEAALPSRIPLYYQLFVRAQMRRFGATVQQIIEEHCP